MGGIWMQEMKEQKKGNSTHFRWGDIIMIEWDGMEWNGMGWNGMEWDEKEGRKSVRTRATFSGRPRYRWQQKEREREKRDRPGPYFKTLATEEQRTTVRARTTRPA